MNTIDVFISYKSEYVEKAREVRSILEENGLSCWLASDDLENKNKYLSVVPEVIASCNFFLLIVSDNIEDSVWIPKELDTAVNCEKIIFPLCIDNHDHSVFPLYLSDVEWYNDCNNVVSIIKELSKKQSFFDKKWIQTGPYKHLTDREEHLAMNTITAYCFAVLLLLSSTLFTFKGPRLTFFILIFIFIDLIWYTSAKFIPFLASRDSKKSIMLSSLFISIGMTVLYIAIVFVAILLFAGILF